MKDRVERCNKVKRLETLMTISGVSYALLAWLILRDLCVSITLVLDTGVFFYYIRIQKVRVRSKKCHVKTMKNRKVCGTQR